MVRRLIMNKIVALVRVSTDKQDVNNQKFAIEKNILDMILPGSRSQAYPVQKNLEIDQSSRLQSD